MRLLVIVVTYNPDLDLLERNLEAYRDYVSEIIIWDNTPGGSHIHLSGIDVYSTRQNMGLPYAYNFAYKYAKEKGFTHIMTMDQDSIWVGFDRYLRQIEKRNEVAIYLVDTKVSHEDGIQEVNDGINSGSIIPIQILDATTGYDPGFFVDAVDEYLHYQAKDLGFKVYLVRNCYLKQRFASPVKTSLLGVKQFTVFNYSPMRLYGIVRNHIILWKKFHLPFKKRYHIVSHYIFRQAFNIVFGEKNKMLKIKALLFGLIDGLLSRKSRINMFK